MISTKECSECKQHKNFSEFRKNNKMLLKISSHCCDCLRSRARKFYAANKQRLLLAAKEKRKNNLLYVRKRERNWRLRNQDRSKGKTLQKYWPGSSWREALNNFKLLQELQNNLCASCGSAETKKYNRPPHQILDLCVDHCHNTGKVRGLLCDACNVMLGLAKDNPKVCRDAAVYLEKSSA